MLPTPLVALVIASQLSPVTTTFGTPAMVLWGDWFKLTPDGKLVTDGITWIDLTAEKIVSPPIPIGEARHFCALTDGRHVTADDKTHTLRLHDGPTVRVASGFPFREWDCSAVDPGGKRIARVVEAGNSGYRVEVTEWAKEDEQSSWVVVAGAGKSQTRPHFNATGTHLFWKEPAREEEGTPGSLVVHSFATGETVRLTPDRKDSTRGCGVAVDPKGTRAAIVADAATHLFDLSTGNCDRVVPHPPGSDTARVFQAVFTPDGRTLLASGLNPRRLECIPLDEKQKPGFIEVGDGDWVNRFAATADGKRVVVRDDGGVVRVYDLASGRRLDRGTHDTWQGVAWLTESHAVCWSRRGRIVVWDTRTGKTDREFTIGPLDEASHGLARLTPTLDGKYLAATEERAYAEYGQMRVLDATTGKQLFALPDRLRVLDWAFRQDGAELGVSASDPNADAGERFTLRRYSVPSGKEVGKLPFAPDLFRYAADGRSVVALEVSSLPGDRSLKWIELATGKPRWTTRLEDIGLLFQHDLRFGTDDERQTVWLQVDGGTQVFDRATGRAKEQVNAPNRRRGYDPQFASADDRWLVQVFHPVEEAGKGHFLVGELTFAVHDLRDTSPLAAPLIAPIREDALRDAAIRTDGKRLILLTPDGVQKVWDLDMWRALGAITPWAKVWENLAADADSAGQAMAVLASDPERTVKLLAEKLPSTTEPNADDVKRWIGELGSPDFKTRHEAERRLGQVADVARKWILAAAENPPNAEAGERLERLMAKIDHFAEQPDSLRVVRAVEVVERLRTPAAVKLLERWAGGAPDALLTTEAKASLKRMK